MEREFKFKFILAKAYFDKGWGLLSPAKYAIALFGLASSDVVWTMIIGFAYCIFCYFFGRFWFKHKLMDAENEVNNRVNPFVNEMREKFGIPNK